MRKPTIAELRHNDVLRMAERSTDPEELNDNEVERVTHCDDAIIIFVK